MSYDLTASLDEIADAVSEAVDQHCFRSFVVPTEATVRYFRPTYSRIEVDELDDIANTTGLAVAVDVSGDGTWTILDPADYIVDTNRSGMVTAIRSTSAFPTTARRPYSIRVTARFGWPAVPAPVKRAALLWAVRLHDRKNSPTGVLGFGDMGAIRLSRIDPDVDGLLAPYVDRGRLLR